MKSKIFAVLMRVLIEFGIPSLIALCWTILELGFHGEISAYVKNFSVAFFIASWVWGQLLRIIYQQTQAERITGIGGQLRDMKQTMSELRNTVLSIRANSTIELQPTIDTLTGLISMANSQVESANNAIESVEGKNWVRGVPPREEWEIAPWSKTRSEKR
jgi:hypothetical protein